MKNVCHVLFNLLGLAICVLSCEKSTPFLSEDVSGISLMNTEVFVGYTSAKVYGKIRVTQKPERISEVQVLYGPSRDNLTMKVKAAYDSKNGFSADLKLLEDGAQYFYRVDIIVKKTPIVGAVNDFVTFPQGPVDLDLPSGKKWASHNVGASQPSESGGYFSWAELKEKTQYDWITYAYCMGAGNKLTKYTLHNNLSYDGTIDYQVEMLPKDDVATQTLGEHYSVPSYKDWVELIDNCILEKMTVNGCEGCKISSKTDMNNNKKFIFLPGGYGYYSGTTIIIDASYYWSSTLYSEHEDKAINFAVRSNINSKTGYRYYGELVRPIYK